MKYVNTFIKGEIYYTIMPDNLQWESLHLCVDNSNNPFQYRLYTSSLYLGDRFDKTKWGHTKLKDYRIATLEEKHWLLECIKLDKFITLEEAMKTFKSELEYEIC